MYTATTTKATDGAGRLINQFVSIVRDQNNQVVYKGTTKYKSEQTALAEAKAYIKGV